jgi:hypothetical protein
LTSSSSKLPVCHVKFGCSVSFVSWVLVPTICISLPWVKSEVRWDLVDILVNISGNKFVHWDFSFLLLGSKNMQLYSLGKVSIGLGIPVPWHEGK